MSVLSGVDCPGTADAFEQPRTTDQGTAGAGVYLTDGIFLYRLVESAAVAQDDVVELEDCYLLDVVRVLVSDLRGRGLRVVTPVSKVPATAQEPMTC
jgi:hypothetical protein